MTAASGASLAVVEVVVLPSAGLLLPEYVGLTDPGAPIGDRCTDAVRAALSANPDHVVLLAGHDRAPRHTRGSLGARIGRRALYFGGWSGRTTEVIVPFDASAAEVSAAVAQVGAVVGRVVLVVVGDGCAKRSEKAPGHFDERSLALDGVIGDALADADPAALATLDPVLCQELWATGRAALQVLGGICAGAQCRPRTYWFGEPYGVAFFVARWSVGAVADPGSPRERPAGTPSA